MSPKHARPEPAEEPSGDEPVARHSDAAVPAEVTPADEPGAVAPAEVSPGDDPAEDPPGDDPADAASDQPAPARRRTRRGGRRTPPVRSRWMWALLALLGFALVAWVGATVLGSDGTPDSQASPSPTASPQQRTMLLQVRNDDDLGADNLVAAVGTDLPPAQLLVPSRLIVDVPGAGQQTLGQSARMLDRSASQDALSDLLALRIDGTISLARVALAGMVDFVGGITVTVDEPVTQTDPKTGAQTVVVPAGSQLLNGTQAAAYALAWLPDEPEASRLARYSTVMTETLAALPDDQLQVEQMLTSLGGSARTTTSTADAASFLLDMREAIVAGGQQVRVLPTTDIDSGAGLEMVRADLTASQALLETLMPTALLSSDESTPRVLVQNGVGTPGLGASARDRLVAAGMVFINGGNADQFGTARTQVIVKDSTAESQELGERVATALDVPQSAVSVAEDGQNVADVVVVLGADFEP